MTAIDFSYDLA
jgi:DNA-binding transcriptional LysR family regulator